VTFILGNVCLDNLLYISSPPPQAGFKIQVYLIYSGGEFSESDIKLISSCSVVQN
jgi:hypothetical protein